MKHNKQAPHQAVVLIKVEIMENLPNGQVSGIPIKKWSDLLIIGGKNFNECKEKTQTILKKIKEEL